MVGCDTAGNVGVGVVGLEEACYPGDSVAEVVGTVVADDGFMVGSGFQDSGGSSCSPCDVEVVDEHGVSAVESYPEGVVVLVGGFIIVGGGEKSGAGVAVSGWCGSFVTVIFHKVECII